MIEPKLHRVCLQFEPFFIRNSYHVLGAPTGCSHLHKPQIMRPNAVTVSCRQNACMLRFTSAISDFNNLETLLWIESLALGEEGDITVTFAMTARQ